MSEERPKAAAETYSRAHRRSRIERGCRLYHSAESAACRELRQKAEKRRRNEPGSRMERARSPSGIRLEVGSGMANGQRVQGCCGLHQLSKACGLTLRITRRLCSAHVRRVLPKVLPAWLPCESRCRPLAVGAHLLPLALPETTFADCHAARPRKTHLSAKGD